MISAFLMFGFGFFLENVNMGFILEGAKILF